MRTTDRVFGNRNANGFVPVETWTNVQCFSRSAESVVGKLMPRRFACRRSPKRLLERVGSGAPLRFFFGEQTRIEVRCLAGALSGRVSSYRGGHSAV